MQHGGRLVIMNPFLLNAVPGAIYSYEDSLVNISGSVSYTGNFAGNDGGAIFVYRAENLSITGARFTSNEATTYGGALLVTATAEQEHRTFGELTFENNSAGSDGGALWLGTESGWNSLRSSSFDNNRAGTGHMGYTDGRTTAQGQADRRYLGCSTVRGDSQRLFQ